MKVEIDDKSGFCEGVINAIQTAERYLSENKQLYCLGDIVHNSEEVNRLKELGLEIISQEQFKNLKNTTVLIRAHGESPITYQIAKENNVTIIDATCPVVLQLQKKIKNKVEEFPEAQLVIYGKVGHAEVIGLLGQTQGKGIVISSMKDIEILDFTKPIHLYAQTTQNKEEYHRIALEIEKRCQTTGVSFTVFDTICRRVARRVSEIQAFVKNKDVIIFVSGEKSSNGLYLYGICKSENPETYFVSKIEQLDEIKIAEKASIGICGATYTPRWLMEKVMQKIENR